MNVLCATCHTRLAAGEAMILHESHRVFRWFCDEHWARGQRMGQRRLAEEHAAGMVRARRHVAVTPREGNA